MRIEDYKKNINKSIVLIVLPIVVFFAIIFSMGADITLKSGVQVTASGSVQLFSGIHKFSEENSDTAEMKKLSEDGTLQLRTRNGCFTRIRFDFDNQTDIYIEEIIVEKLKVNYRDLDAEGIMELLEKENDCKAELTDAGVHITATGKDAYIVLKNMGYSNDIVYYIWCAFLLCLFVGIICGGYLLIRVVKKSEKDTEKIIRYSVFLIFIVLLTVIDVKPFRTIQRQEARVYSVDSNNGQYEVLEEAIEFDIYIHGKNVRNIEFLFESIEGNAVLSIYEENGELLGETEISDVAESFMQGSLSFPVEQFELQVNHEYRAVLSVDSDEEVKIYCKEEGVPWNRQIFKADYKWVYYVILAVTNLIVITGMALLLKFGLNNKVFLVISVSFGAICTVLAAPASQDDEYRHFIRAYELAKGEVVSEFAEPQEKQKGNLIQENNGMVALATVPEELNQIRLLDDDYNYDDVSYIAELNYDISLDKWIGLLSKKPNDETVSVAQAGVWSLNFFSYWPQVLGICIGKIFGLHPFLLCYMARLGNVIACSFIVYSCLKLIPRYKAAIWVIHFMPGIFLLRSSSSSDGLIIALTMFLVSYILYLKEKQVLVFTLKNILILLGITAYLAILKLPYILMIGVLIILDKDNYKKEKLIFGKSVGLALLIFVGAYVVYTSYGVLNMALVNKVYSEGQKLVGTPFVDQTHIQYIISQPGEVIGLFADYMTQIIQAFESAVNGRLYPYAWTYALLVFAVVALLKKNGMWWQRLLSLLLYCGIWLVILFVFFSLTEPGAGYIWGLNPRYMIPMIPMLLVILPQGNDKTAIWAERGQVLTVTITAANLLHLFSVYWI